MKKILFIFLVAGLAFISCQSPKPKIDTNKTPVVASASVEATLRVEGMTCTECEQSIAKGVKQLPGIDSISANHLDSTAFVRFDPAKTDLPKISAAIEGRGYHVAKAIKK